MTNQPTKKSWLKISLLIFLLVISTFFASHPAWAVVGSNEGEGEGEDPVVTRQKEDKTQTEREIKTTQQLQKDDETVCKEEVNGSLGLKSLSPNSSSDPYDSNNPYSPYYPSKDPANVNVPAACSDGDTAGYVAANEGGVYRTAYTDSEGYRTVGIGHKITGNEPDDIKASLDAGTPLTDEQVGRLYNADMATARNCAEQSATDHGVDWDGLSTERQTVLVDMSYNMGCSGGEGVSGFNNMWGNIRDAQQTNNQTSWDAAGDEITNSTYGSQVGGRADNNANIMRTSDASIIDGRTASNASAQNYCGGSLVFWRKPLVNFFAYFQYQVAEAAGLYVPVVEQQGDLMTYNKKIEDHTEKIRKLSIDICTHLRAIRRIQSRFEQKMVEDADAARISSTEIAKYAQALYGDNGVVKKGGSRIDEDGNEITDQPLYVMNNQQYLENASEEGREIALDQLAQTNNIYNTAIFAGLNNEDTSAPLSGPSIEDIQTVLGLDGTQDDTGKLGSSIDRIPFASTILKPVRKTLAWATGNSAWAAESTSKKNGVESDRFWNSFLSVVKNSPESAYLRSAAYVENQRNRAVLAAQDTATQGQGFLPIRKCVAKTADGKACAVWGIVTPGIAVKETTVAALNSRLVQYETGKTKGEIGQGNEPNVSEILTLTPTKGGGGAPGPGDVTLDNLAQQDNSDLRSDAQTNPFPTNNASQNGNPDTDNSGYDWSTFQNLFSSITEGEAIGGSASPSSADLTFLQWLIRQIAGAYKDLKPLVVFKFKPIDGDQRLIYWSSPNANDCLTSNDWVNNTETIKKIGTSLTNSGKLTVTATTSTGQAISYKLKCKNSKGTTEKEISVE